MSLGGVSGGVRFMEHSYIVTLYMCDGEESWGLGERWMLEELWL